jgi:hypothetical protein
VTDDLHLVGRTQVLGRFGSPLDGRFREKGRIFGRIDDTLHTPVELRSQRSRIGGDGDPQIGIAPEYAAFFPETTIKRGARPPEYLRTADEVEIIGHRGGLLSVGREGALTGNRVDCFILDDLYRK